MNRRLWWIGAAAVCFSASVLFARQGVIRTRDGKTIEGDIEEKPDQVVISLHGIKTAINRENIEGEVEYFDNIEARYQDRVSKLPKKPTAADRLALARWLFGVKAYDLAQKEIDEARKIDPNSADAATLEQTVISQRRIEQNRTTTTPPAPGAKPPTTPGAAAPAAAGDKPRLVTPEEINIIRQVEWREKDAAVPRVTVPPDVRRRYVDLKALDPGQFAALTMPQQAYYILTDADAPAEMKREIKVTTDPQAIAEYRRGIQPLVLNNCATAGCHGGWKGGDFVLYSNNPEKDVIAYTNFLILQKYKKSFGEKEYYMIDRTYPERSILAQFALSPETAELKHPELKAQTYKPIAGSRAAPAYKTIVGWMKELQAGGPNYGFDYDPQPASSKKAEPAPKAEPPKADGGKTVPPTSTPPAKAPPSGNK
jgi:hypothetical protein